MEVSHPGANTVCPVSPDCIRDASHGNCQRNAICRKPQNPDRNHCDQDQGPSRYTHLFLDESSSRSKRTLVTAAFNMPQF